MSAPLAVIFLVAMVTKIELPLMLTSKQFYMHDIGRNIYGSKVEQYFLCYLKQCLGVELGLSHCN